VSAHAPSPLPQLTGQLPDAYKALTSLRTLALNNNAFSGRVPASWGPGLAALTSPYLFNNTGITGCAPSGWSARLASDFDVDFFLLVGTRLHGFCKSTS
jgi:hypothetical protein